MNNVLDVIHHDLRLINQGMMHGLVEHFLELHVVFSDGDVMQ